MGDSEGPLPVVGLDASPQYRTHLSPSEQDKLKKYGYRQTFYSSFKKFFKKGVSILIYNSLNFDLLKEISDKEGRYV